MAESKEMLLVVSKVKEAVKGHGMRSNEEFLTALSELVHGAIKSAVENAKNEKRQTLNGEDV